MTEGNLKKKPCVLSILAHPDDAEFFCAGTLIRLQERGFETHIATMTPGDCGSMEHGASEIAGMRRREAAAAAAKIRGHYHCLGGRDLLVRYDPEHIQAAVEMVRQVAPDIVITHAPQDYHLDHEMTSLVVRNACFAASAPNFDTGRRPAQAATSSIPHLYYASPAAGTDIFGQAVVSSVYIDISEVVGLKADMLACHRSQREWLQAQHGMDEYIEEMSRWNGEQGKQAGVEFAEGFRQHLGHPYPQDDKLTELLGAKK